MRVPSIAVLLLSLAASGAARGGECLDQLDELGVDYRPVHRAHVEDAVEVRGDLGGVIYESYQKKPLVAACVLVVALAKAGPTFTAHDIIFARFSSAYSRRHIRGSGHWSQHAFGRAIDIHTFGRRDGTYVTLRDAYEQGLGDENDCVGEPLTPEGRLLRQLSCELRASALFENVLDPDYNAQHYNHFHLDLAH